MHPILFEYSVFGQQRVVAGYGLMIALGVLFGVGVVVFLSRRRQLDVVNVVLVALIAIGAGILGSYLLFVVTVLPEAIHDPAILLMGGLVFYGGPLLGVPAGYIASRKLALPPLKVADIAAPALTLGHALGRMGCFLGGCCFGNKHEGPLAVIFTHPLAPAAHPSMPRHPVQLYESLFLLILSLLLMLTWSRAKGDGRVALVYVVTYACWRIFIETMRNDTVRGYLIPGLITTSQSISLALIPAALIGLWLLRRRERAKLTSNADLTQR